MITVELGNVKLEIDRNATEKFYKSQNGFISELNGLEKQLGIDLTKAVGQGMDELMPHDYDDYHLYVIPYYLIGKCFINENELKKQSFEPIWKKTKKAEYKLTENLSLRIIETNKYVEIENAENILTIWLEYKTELIEK